MEAGRYGLTRETCFLAYRLELDAVAGLLWISWCVLGAAGFFRVVFFVFLFFERTLPAASTRPPCLIYLSTSTIHKHTHPWKVASLRPEYNNNLMFAPASKRVLYSRSGWWKRIPGTKGTRYLACGYRYYTTINTTVLRSLHTCSSIMPRRGKNFMAFLADRTSRAFLCTPKCTLDMPNISLVSMATTTSSVSGITSFTTCTLVCPACTLLFTKMHGSFCRRGKPWSFPATRYDTRTYVCRLRTTVVHV